MMKTTNKRKFDVLAVVVYGAKNVMSCTVWGALGGGKSCVPPSIFFAFWWVFMGFPATVTSRVLLLLFVCFLLGLYATTPFSEVDWTLIGYSLFLTMATIGTAYGVDDAFRKYFSALHVIGQYHEQLSTSASDEKKKHDDGGPMEVLKRTLKTAQTVNAELVRRSEEARKALKAKELFMATMSHEMRSPLHSIVALSALLIESSDLDEHNHSTAATINASATHLMTVVNDILDFTALQSRKMHLVFESFSLHSFVENVVAISTPLINPQVSFVSVVSPPMSDVKIVSDAMRLRQISCNLLSNAAKFTEVGGVTFRVEIRRVNEEKNQQELLLEIKDSGIGIPDEHKDKLFTPFEQSDNTICRKYGGTGLGLVVTKELIDLFGGQISYSSKVGEGTVFSVSIPLGTKPLPPGATNAIDTPPSCGQPATRPSSALKKSHSLRSLEGKRSQSMRDMNAAAKADNKSDGGGSASTPVSSSSSSSGLPFPPPITKHPSALTFNEGSSLSAISSPASGGDTTRPVPSPNQPAEPQTTTTTTTTITQTATTTETPSTSTSSYSIIHSTPPPLVFHADKILESIVVVYETDKHKQKHQDEDRERLSLIDKKRNKKQYEHGLKKINKRLWNFVPDNLVEGVRSWVTEGGGEMVEIREFLDRLEKDDDEMTQIRECRDVLTDLDKISGLRQRHSNNSNSNNNSIDDDQNEEELGLHLKILKSKDDVIKEEDQGDVVEETGDREAPLSKADIVKQGLRIHIDTGRAEDMGAVKLVDDALSSSSDGYSGGAATRIDSNNDHYLEQIEELKRKFWWHGRKIVIVLCMERRENKTMEKILHAIEKRRSSTEFDSNNVYPQSILRDKTNCISSLFVSSLVILPSQISQAAADIRAESLSAPSVRSDSIPKNRYQVSTSSVAAHITDVGTALAAISSTPRGPSSVCSSVACSPRSPASSVSSLSSPMSRQLSEVDFFSRFHMEGKPPFQDSKSFDEVPLSAASSAVPSWWGRIEYELPLTGRRLLQTMLLFENLRSEYQQQQMFKKSFVSISGSLSPGSSAASGNGQLFARNMIAGGGSSSGAFPPSSSGGGGGGGGDSSRTCSYDSVNNSTITSGHNQFSQAFGPPKALTPTSLSFPSLSAPPPPAATPSALGVLQEFPRTPGFLRDFTNVFDQQQQGLQQDGGESHGIDEDLDVRLICLDKKASGDGNSLVKIADGGGGGGEGAPSTLEIDLAACGNPLSSTLSSTATTTTIEQQQLHQQKSPLGKPQQQQQQQAPSPNKLDISSLRVLVVDDNAINRRVAQQLLKRCGVSDMESAEDGLEAVNKVDEAMQEAAGGGKRPFDLILMDLHMPVMDGRTAAHEIQRKHGNKGPLVIACTADVFAAPDEALPLALTKPFTAGQLSDTLQECRKNGWL